MILVALASLTATVQHVGTPPRFLHLIRSASLPKGLSYSGAVRALLTIDLNGRVIHCDIVASQAPAAIEEVTCKSLTSSLFAPAKDAANRKIYSTVSQSVIYFEDGKSTPISSDLSLVVNHLPSPLKTTDTVFEQAILAMDIAGNVRACEPLKATHRFEALERAVCQMATKRMTFKPVLDETGEPVEALQLLSVDFSSADAPTEHKITIPRPTQ
jgi:hypothetical protein